MKIALKAIRHELEIKNNGIEFSVRDSNGEHLGDFYIRKSGVVWSKGKKSIDTGQAKTWAALIKWLEA